MTNPWKAEPEPEVAPQLATCEAVYTALIRALHSRSRDEDLSTLASAVAVLDLANDLIVNSGLLWQTPDFVAAPRGIADQLETRQKDGAARPLQITKKRGRQTVSELPS